MKQKFNLPSSIFWAIVIAATFLICFQPLNAQEKVITGSVTDEDGNPLAGVNVFVPGTTIGTITDNYGKYRLEVPPEAEILRFSFIGMETKDVEIGDRTQIDVTLVASAIGLKEVIVVGYGIQRRSDVTGSISSVRADDIENLSITRPEQALQGKAAGVQVIPAGNSPGAGIKVRVRGVSTHGKADPIYIVDGIKTGDVNYLDPNDIERIEVLKDAASAAIYGAEGANGVVLITTKSAKPGESVLEYEFQNSYTNVGHIPEVMGSKEYIKYQEDAGREIDQISQKVDHNWLEDIFETGYMQRHYLSYSGAGKNYNLYIAGSYLTQDGIITGPHDQFQRYSIRVNSEHQITNWLKVGEKAAFTHFIRKAIAEDNEYGGVIASALQLDPTTPVKYTDESQIPEAVKGIIAQHPNVGKDKNGNIYGISPYVTGEIVNPFVILEYGAGSRGPGVKQDKLLGDVFAELTPIKNLSIISRIGIDMAWQVNHRWNPVYYYNDLRYNEEPSLNEDIDNWYTWQWDNYVTYNKEADNYNMSIMAGMSAQQYRHRYTSLFASPMGANKETFAEFDYVTSTENDEVGGYTDDDRLLGYFGRLSFNLKEKYLFLANIRRDGASLSKLPKEGRWGTFPSLSAGWIISNEGFFPETFISFLKVRASWGKNGSLSNLGSYEYIGFITSSGLQYPLPDGSMGIPAEPNRLNNPDLTWETTVQTDIGIDLRAFNDRLTFSLDYYNKKTTDLLTPNTPPFGAGNTSAFINAGDVTNKGFEFEIGLRNYGIYTDEFQYSININLATNENEVTYLNPTISRITGPNVGPGWIATATEKGYPIWYFRGYKVKGIDPETGNAIFEDISKDSIITSDDMTMIGNPHPKLIFGGSVNLAYKGFDFTISFQGASGKDALIGWVRNDRAYCNKPTVLTDDHWSPDNPDGTMPGPNAEAITWNSDLMVFDASYLRIQQIQLGYTFPSSFIKNFNLKGLRVYISLDNYFTFTKYPGFDPDAGSGNDNSIGIDRGVYPAPRNIVFGTSISL